MAERIISAGVFTQENDLSFLATGIGQIGAAIIGPTIKGPALVPTLIESQDDFAAKFGGTNEKMYTPYCIREYLKNAGRVTVVRVLGLGGYGLTNPVAIKDSAGIVLAVLAPSTNYPLAQFNASTIQGSVSGFTFSLSGSTNGTTALAVSTHSGSFIETEPNYMSNIYGGNAQTTNTNAHLYLNFPDYQSAHTGALHLTASFTNQPMKFQTDYAAAQTPWIQSQTVGGSKKNLFRVVTISHGDNTNTEFKIAISDVKFAGEVAGSDYGSFTLSVRGVNGYFESTDNDRNADIREIFANIDLNPDSPNFIAKMIGDQYVTVNSDGKLIRNNDFPNKSKHVRIEMSDDLKNGTISPTLVPFGFAALNTPVGGDLASFVPSASFVTAQIYNSEYNSKIHYGFDYSSDDNSNYLKPLPSGSTTGLNAAFNLESFNGHPSSSYTGSLSGSSALTEQLKFTIPFQGGFDGWNPATPKYVGSSIVAGNTMGFDLSSATTSGSTVYKRAIDTVSNPDLYDINMLVLPGVISRLHTTVSNHADEMITDRKDVFFVKDVAGLTDTISQAVAEAGLYDDSYSACYYPWVKIYDFDLGKAIWVPPSVVLPGVIAYNDKVGYEWYAPAGLTRGGLTNALDVYTILTRGERDDLYSGKVNPIAMFPNQGVVVWGQKTLQTKTSALDRVNVRRLLIGVKKYIASTTRYLVFDQNTSALRNKFLGIVNPYLESIQQRAGLYAFKAVMDESNNTPDLVDKYIMYGQLWLQPTRTSEFIIIDMNILPTGAAFSQ